MFDVLAPVQPCLDATLLLHANRFAGQFSLHMGCMVYAVARSKEHLDEDYEPDLDGDFKPNMINSVVFLVGAVQQVPRLTVARTMLCGVGLCAKYLAWGIYRCL